MNANDTRDVYIDVRLVEWGNSLNSYDYIQTNKKTKKKKNNQ
jgi:hypothetical protein